MTEQEVDLPPISSSQDQSPPETYELHNGRKRPRLEYDLSTSSDPALFSSDDHAPTAEDYASKRRKKKWQGTWWGEKVKGSASGTSTGSKREFTRNFDSGVWMGSEGTDTSLEDEILDELRSTDNKSCLPLPPIYSEQRLNMLEKDVVALDDASEYEVPHCHIQETASKPTRNALLNAAVDKIIDRCLEAGDENVDLSSMSLDHVPNESLRRLRSLTKHTTIWDIPPSQDSYSSLEPTLRLYLSNNGITSFPSEVLNLANLSVLSLRHNKLTKLPPALAKLPRLTNINIAGNELKNLPYEMLDLYKRPDFQMNATANPFSQPQSAIPPNSDIEKWMFTTNPLFLAQQKPIYFHADGSKANDAAPRGLCSRVPSLLEFALRKCKDLPDLMDIEKECTAGGGPSTLAGPLAMAQEATKYGDLECTVCGRSYVLPRVQWLEWYMVPIGSRRDFASSNVVAARHIPFLRQGCSWSCVDIVEVTVAS
ncbi:hypothetical protein GJ744_008219 [Endocarpon pusillum]|uniref:Uncharacterized protein n=1 Tax=Endocarpon pusillum TaxID=364733 RepID=A0A8H7AHQ1_9EURO|nr:hypothetical protein GJ744_008219 [Endocarpon pusillum]